MQELITYLLVGSFAGFQAGLLGVGGGLIIVPVLIFSFALHNIEGDIATHMAVATSLATIAVTSISSVHAHNKLGNVNWSIFKILTPGILLGVWFGVNTALSLSAATLQICLGVFAITVATKMAFGFDSSSNKGLPGPAGMVGAGVVIGWVSAIFGIGGGNVNIPFMRWRGIDMKIAVATSAACGLPIALMGALTNAMKGLQHENLPEYSLGYVYLPAFIGIIATSAIFAKFGAKTASKLSPSILQSIFIFLLVCIGLTMIIKNIL